MNKYLSILFKHWQSSVVGLLIIGIGLMFFTKHIDTQEFGMAITTVLGLAAFFMKDPNKTQSKE